MADYHKPDQQTLQALRDTANRLRILSIKATSAAGSGHPTSCCSAAEIMSVLFFHTMKYKPMDPKNPNNDRFVMSKGHAAPILYAAWAEVGYIPESELLNLRKLDSILEGHPVPVSSPSFQQDSGKCCVCQILQEGEHHCSGSSSWKIWNSWNSPASCWKDNGVNICIMEVRGKRQEFTDVATGSLGQGLGAAAGMAYTGKYFDKASYRVYCLLGDGETSEGSVWEAMNFAGFYKLDNLTAIIDVNRLGQSDPTPLQHKVDIYQKRCEAFGWHAVVVDGHSVEELCKAFTYVKNQPIAIIAKTFKGKGISGVEDKENWHGKPLPKDATEKTIKEIESKIQSKKKLTPALPAEDAPIVSIKNIKMLSPPNFKLGDKIATRKAYGLALAKLGHANDRVIALDGDTKNSTFSELFKKEHPDRFIESYIAEQNMVSVAVGSATRDRVVPFASAFATFFTRAFDQIRMAAISESNINLCGSHCGVSIGEDGASQMGLEDLTMFRVVPNATVFYPSDAVSTEKAVELAANTKGICFIRTSRPENAVIYNNNEEFKIGHAKVVHQCKDDQVTVIGAGVTLHEALAAAEHLSKKEKIFVRVIDPFTIKPLDKQTILENARATKGRIITVEDHYHEGGIGEAVAAAMVGEPGITVKSLAVSGIPRSGKPAELLKMFGIDKDAIVEAVKKVV